MIQWIKEQILGVAATGIPISEIKMTVKTTYPDTNVPITQMHQVIYTAMQDIRKKLGDHN